MNLNTFTPSGTLTMKNIRYFQSLVFCCLLQPSLILGELPSLPVLRQGYQNAMDQWEKDREEALKALKAEYLTRVNRMSQQFREEGNIGFHLEAKNYADFLNRDQMEYMNWERVQNDGLKAFHEQRLRAVEVLENQMKIRKFHVMNRMQEILTQMLENDKLDAGVKTEVREQLAEMKQSPEFTALQQQHAEQQQARELAATQRANQTPLPTPTALPITEVPRVDLDVFRKNTGKTGAEYYHTQLKIQIRSKEMRRVYENISIDVWIFERMEGSSDNFRIHNFETIRVGELKLGQFIEKESGENRTSTTRATPGTYNFFGYVVTVKDGNGKPLQMKTFPNRINDDRAKEVMKHREGDLFTLDM